KCIRRRDESVGRHDDFVAGLQLKQNRSHFQRRCTGVSEKSLPATYVIFEPGVAALGVWTIPGQVATFQCVSDVFQRLCTYVRLVERYFHDAWEPSKESARVLA